MWTLLHHGKCETHPQQDRQANAFVVVQRVMANCADYRHGHCIDRSNPRHITLPLKSSSVVHIELLGICLPMELSHVIKMVVLIPSTACHSYQCPPHVGIITPDDSWTPHRLLHLGLIAVPDG